MTPAELDALQVRLLELLAGEDPDPQAALDAEVDDPLLREWVRRWRPDLLELAGHLVRTWAVTDGGHAVR